MFALNPNPPKKWKLDQITAFHLCSCLARPTAMPLFSLSRTRKAGPPIEVIGLGTQSIKFKYFICCCWSKPAERIFCLNPFNPFEILLRLPGQQARNGFCYFFSGAGTTVLIFHESSHSSSTGTTGRNQSSIRYTPHPQNHNPTRAVL